MIHALNLNQATEFLKAIKQEFPQIRIKKRFTHHAWETSWFDDTQLPPSTRMQLVRLLTHRSQPRPIVQ